MATINEEMTKKKALRLLDLKEVGKKEDIMVAFKAKVKSSATGDGGYKGDMDDLVKAKEALLKIGDHPLVPFKKLSYEEFKILTREKKLAYMKDARRDFAEKVKWCPQPTYDLWVVESDWRNRIISTEEFEKTILSYGPACDQFQYLVR